MMLMRAGILAAAIACASSFAQAEPVLVRHAEGEVHGFLVLGDLEGKRLADGDLTQLPHGRRVTVRLVFRFLDGSLHDETAVFSQTRQFHLVTDHLVQKGPAFPRTLDQRIDVRTGTVTVMYTDDKGHEKRERTRMDLPADLANGVILTLLKNVDPRRPPKSFSFVAASPSPRLVSLELSSVGTEAFRTGGARRDAVHYVLAVKAGGLAGLLAPLVGKQPPDSHVWILGGDAPAFVKWEGPLAAGGPVWRIELASPVWPSKAPAEASR